MKLLFVCALIPTVLYPIYAFVDIPSPDSFCKIIDCSFFKITSIKIIICFGFIVSIILYLAEKYMLIALGSLLIITILTFSFQQSNGYMGVTGILSGILLAQLLAYAFKIKNKKYKLSLYRVQYALQIVAACYILAGISKVTTSGFFQWINDTKYMSLQILKSFNFFYVTDGNIESLNKGLEMSNYVLEHVVFFELLLGASLVMELFAFILFFNKKSSIIFGLLLLGMHIGIFIVMKIILLGITISCITFTINPLYLLFATVSTLYQKSASAYQSYFLKNTRT